MGRRTSIQNISFWFKLRKILYETEVDYSELSQEHSEDARPPSHHCFYPRSDRESALLFFVVFLPFQGPLLRFPG